MSEGKQNADPGGVPVDEPLHPLPSTPLPPGPAPTSELVRRLGTAAVLIPSLIYIIIQGGLLYLATVIGIVLLGLLEFYRMIEAKGAQPLRQAGLAAGAALSVVAYVGNEYYATILMTAVLLALMIAQLGKQEISDALASISGTFFGVFYVGWLMSHVVVLRGFHGVVVSKWGADVAAEVHPQSGIFLVLFVVSTVVLCDAGAYFAGRALGKRTLAPKISPNKTVEGALGGMVVGMGTSLLCKGIFDLFWPELSRVVSWQVAPLLGLVLGAAAITGDLVESLLKRDAQQKDTGALLPGMGGVLDRIDSPLLAIPVMYYLLLGYLFVRLG